MTNETHAPSSDLLTSDAGGAFSGTIEHPGVDTLIDVFVELADAPGTDVTATGISSITITDERRKDILNGEGATPLTASHTYALNDTRGVSARGHLTIAGTGAGNTKTLRVHPCFKR